MMAASGILKNTANIFDAEDYKKGSSTVIYDSKYHNGCAVTCDVPNEVIFDTGDLVAGESFAGTYNVKFFYDSSTATTQGTPLFRFSVLEDGVELEEDTSLYLGGYVLYQYDLNYVEHVLEKGLSQPFEIKANKTYQIIVKTSEYLVDDAILDYIVLEKIPANTMLDGRNVVARAGMRNVGNTTDISTYGTQPVVEVLIGNFTGTFSAGGDISLGYTYNTKFKTILVGIPNLTNSNGQIKCEYTGYNSTTSQVNIYFKNIGGVDWTGATSSTLTIIVIGYI
jgi:hypothetical protein